MLNGFILGLSNNVLCFLNCAVILFPLILSSQDKSYIPILKFLLGRFIAYMFFGFTAGYISIYFNGRIDPLIFSVFQIILSLWLILYAFGKLNLNLSFCKLLNHNIKGTFLPIFMGFVLGVNICPPFLLGLSTVLNMNSIIKPVIFFVGFFIGSSLWLLPLFFTDKFTNNRRISFIGRIIAIMIGLWYLKQGFFAFFQFIY